MKNNPNYWYRYSRMTHLPINGINSSDIGSVGVLAQDIRQRKIKIVLMTIA
jgi:hypothetical protein